MTVIVIDSIMAVPVTCPETIFLKLMRMAVVGDHLGMILKRVGNRRNMREGRKDRPDDK